MPTYIALANFTDQGIRSIKDTAQRAAANEKAVKKMGVEMKALYWTMGQYDLVSIMEAPDDVSMSAVSLAIGAAGNIRGQTLRAYTRQEMEAILKKIA
jgi:uncharacterized protein with GYD domain